MSVSNNCSILRNDITAEEAATNCDIAIITTLEKDAREEEKAPLLKFCMIESLKVQ